MLNQIKNPRIIQQNQCFLQITNPSTSVTTIISNSPAFSLCNPAFGNFRLCQLSLSLSFSNGFWTALQGQTF